MVNINISEVLHHLENGVVRYTDSQGYDLEFGSIMEKFELSKADVKRMFEHPLLKNKKTRPAPKFNLVDDVSTSEPAVAELVEATTEVQLTEEVAETPQSQPEISSESPSVVQDQVMEQRAMEASQTNDPSQQF